MPITVDTSGGLNLVDVWAVPNGTLGVAFTPQNIRGHLILKTAYGPVDMNDLSATFVQPFAMQILLHPVGTQVTITVT